MLERTIRETLYNDVLQGVLANVYLLQSVGLVVWDGQVNIVADPQ